MWKFRSFETLPDDAAAIRETVFCKEQGFEREFDEIDARATHLLLYVDNRPAAVCRYYREDGKNAWHIGRIAVLKEFRGLGLGAKILQESERLIQDAGGKIAIIGGQTRVAEFYRKMGYEDTGEEYLDEGCPHVRLSKKLA